jgi:hypothetical protein
MKHVYLSTRDSTTSIALVKTAANVCTTASTPILLAASIDCSGSMCEPVDGTNTSRWQGVVDCLEQAVDYRRQHGHADDVVLVVAFNEEARVLIHPVRLADWTEDHVTTLSAVAPIGFTNISSGDALLARELQTYTSGLGADVAKPILVTLHLTDGLANTGLLLPDDIAAAKHVQTQALVDAGYLAVHGFYAVSDDADPSVSRACAMVTGQAVWKHITSGEFAEFSGEVGLLASLAELVTSVRCKGQSALVLKGSWCPIAITGSVDELVVHTPLLGSVLLTCLRHTPCEETGFCVTVEMLEMLERWLDTGHDAPDGPAVLPADGPAVLHRLATECQTVRRLGTQLHGTEESDALARSVVAVLSGYKAVLESAGPLESATDTGVLRQLSSTSQVASELSSQFKTSFTQRYGTAEAHPALVPLVPNPCKRRRRTTD